VTAPQGKLDGFVELAIVDVARGDRLLRVHHAEVGAYYTGTMGGDTAVLFVRGNPKSFEVWGTVDSITAALNAARSWRQGVVSPGEAKR